MRKLHAYYLHGDSPLPAELHGEINDIIQVIKNATSKEKALKTAYDILTSRYKGGRLKTVSRFYDLWSSSWEDIWNRAGFLHCTNQNYLLSLILTKSGHFKPEDIRRKWSLIWLFSPHQYVSVRINDKTWVDVDCWAKQYGVSFGMHATKFNTSIFSVDK